MTPYPSLSWIVFYDDARDHKQWTWIEGFCRQIGAANNACEADSYVCDRGLKSCEKGTVGTLTAYETLIISTGVNPFNEKAKVMHGCLETFGITLNYPGNSISQKNVPQTLGLWDALSLVLCTGPENLEEIICACSL